MTRQTPRWSVARQCALLDLPRSPFYDAPVSILRAADVQISIDGRGRALDNVFVERLWPSVKYEEVYYLKDYETVPVARHGLDWHFGFYNHERPHQLLDYRTPAAVYAEAA